VSLRRIALAAALGLALAGCATAYGPESRWGGYSEQRLSDTVWWVRFGGNGFTTAETVQTYWLYHCADFTLGKGYDGFAITSRVDLTSADRPAVPGAREPRLILASAQGGAVPGQIDLKPAMAGRIRLLKKPFTPVPGAVFDAAALRAQLGSAVEGPKCGGNICPYVHTYLYPAAP
jgi:hypothetical protein